VGEYQDTIMQVVDVKVKGTLFRFLKSNIHGGSERRIDAIEDTLQFNANVETSRNNKRVLLCTNPMDMLEN
jgi:hypothetical protein